MNLRKGFALVLSLVLLFSISFPNISNAASNQNEEFTIIKSYNGDDIQISTERDGTQAVLNFDKVTNDITLMTIEQSEESGEKERLYTVDVETLTSEKIEATFTDIETGEVFSINTDELQASFAFLVPIGIVIGEALLAHLVAAGLAITIAGITYVAATEVIKDLQKKKDNHYAATLKKDVLYIGNSLSLAQAATHLKSSKEANVWSKTGDLAAKVAKEAGGGRAPVPSENHYDKGLKKHFYYSHYHIYNRTGGHSFYGSGRAGLK